MPSKWLHQYTHRLAYMYCMCKHACMHTRVPHLWKMCPQGSFLAWDIVSQQMAH